MTCQHASHPLRLTIYTAFISVAVSACSPSLTVKSAETLQGKTSVNTLTPSQRKAVSAKWWQRFGDMQLVNLIQQALKANPDITVAQASLQAAQAQFAITTADFKPTIAASGSASRNTGNNSVSGGFNASWEVDLLGKKLKGAAIVEGRAVESGQLASIFDEDADFTEALNNIAKELEEDIEPDFSSSIIEEGKMRPNTKFEQAYIDILSALRDIDEEDMDYDFKNRHETTGDDLLDEDISTIEVVDSEPILDEVENCNCVNTQLTFQW